MASEVVSIPMLDFSPLESGTGAVWDTLQGQVMHALESYGCFEVMYDRITPELRDALFGCALPELFDLPLETKMLANSELFSYGYVGQVPGWNFESLQVQGDVEKFTRMLWPQGNPIFCDTVSTYNRHMEVLEQATVQMIFLRLGIEKYYDAYIESTKYGTQMLQYGIRLDQESTDGMNEHFDDTLVSIICQHGVGGLEIQTKEREWIPVVPSRNSFIVLIGEVIQVWTNGRLQAPLHRVRLNGNVKRNSIVFRSMPKNGYITQTPKELIDVKHPSFIKDQIREG